MEPIAKENVRVRSIVKNVYEENKYMLPHLPKTDEFLTTMNSLFDALRFLAIPVRGGYFVLACSVIHFGLLAAIETGAIYKVIKVLAGLTLYSTGNRSVVARVSGSIFYGNAAVSLVLMFRLRRSWTDISSTWAHTERCWGLIGPSRDKRLRPKMIFVIIFMAIGTVAEHVMSMISNVGLDCPWSEFLERYILNSHAFILIQSDYNSRLGVALFVVNKTATIIWNLQDLIIILISMGLSSRYRRLNLCVQELEGQLSSRRRKSDYEEYIQQQTWRRIREAYVRQAALVRSVDKELGPLLLLSNSNNFYFICLQLFLGIGGQKSNIIDKSYVLVSIVWLLLRACTVVLTAANINIESKVALKSLYSCPKECFNIEVQRLQNQLSRDSVALSGMGFFYLDRNMLLDVASAIFRYELVLLEFDKN
uniref:Putative gustatory receptor 14 n=1 Tax=Conopomorpha sinensis TaxID=940481 RepID=A0A3Q8HE89_9NEOP|nr:putative gustatory receptor 14 [Conopomorpha sinensis]